MQGQYGNRTRITHPDGNYITYDYDNLDRLTQVKENGGGVDNPLAARTSLCPRHKVPARGMKAAGRPH